MHTLAIFSDGHTNSTVGLSKPFVTIQDDDRVASGTIRRLVFHTFEDLLRKIVAKKRGPLIGVLNGDMVDLDDKDRTLQIISRNTEEVNTMACEVWEPFFHIAERAYVMRGTEAHTGKSAMAEENFAANFDNVIPCAERHTWGWLPLELDGVRMDIMHHPRGGRGNGQNVHGPVDRLAVGTMFEYEQARETPPDIVIRSHLHTYMDTCDAYRTRAIITPALTYNTDYIYRLGISRQNAIGAILIYCHEGKFFVEPLLYAPERTQWQTV